MQNEKKRPWQILDATTLKLIAIIAMFMDHLCKSMYPSELWLTMVGRITFPIMAFFIAEGASKTSNKRRYAMRLLLFALISEIPFNLLVSGHLFYRAHQNVMFTFFLGLIGCYMIDNMIKGNKTLLSFIVAAGMLFAGYAGKVDYSLWGVLGVMCFYLFRNEKFGMLSALTISNGMVAIDYSNPIQLYGFAAAPLLSMYNGQRGSGMKYLFYIFYPAHLLALWLLVRMV